MAIAITAMIGTMRVYVNAPEGKDNSMLPGKLGRITYILLLILLFGVASGLLGGAIPRSEVMSEVTGFSMTSYSSSNWSSSLSGVGSFGGSGVC